MLFYISWRYLQPFHEILSISDWFCDVFSLNLNFGKLWTKNIERMPIYRSYSKLLANYQYWNQTIENHWWFKGIIDIDIEIATENYRKIITIEKWFFVDPYRCSDLTVDASIKLDISAGAVVVEGSAEYVNNANSSSQVCSVTYTSKNRTMTKKLNQSHLAPGNVTYQTMLDQEKHATHVVSSITYGKNAHFK